MPKQTLYDHPIDGIEIIEPVTPPCVDDVLLGYEIVKIDPECGGCFVEPRPSRMNTSGCLLVGLLTILFWPVACLPCCMKSSYDTCQRPVYGKKE